MAEPAPAPALAKGGGGPRTRRLLVYPGRGDPRWLQLAFLLSFVVYALNAPGFSRSLSQFAAGMVTVITIDTALAYRRGGVLLLPVSGLISSMGLLLLCDSPLVWPYPAIGVLAILSKQFIRVRGKHLFNPLNFGIVVGLLFLTNEMTVAGGRWGGSTVGLVGVACLGVVTAYRARRLDLAATWVLTFAAGALVRAALSGGHLVTILGPMSGASFQLFTFFMVTDPMTTPETRRGRVAFGVMLGVLDAVLRYRQVSYAPFFALFVVSGFMPLFRRYFVPASEEHVWQPRSVALSGGGPPRGGP
jgi:hypothetical protein